MNDNAIRQAIDAAPTFATKDEVNAYASFAAEALAGRGPFWGRFGLDHVPLTDPLCWDIEQELPMWKAVQAACRMKGIDDAARWRLVEHELARLVAVYATWRTERDA